MRQITLMSGELIGTLTETVWMLNPKHSDLESLVNFLCRFVAELCRLAEIRCRIDALSVDESTPLGDKFRRNMSLAVKETINRKEKKIQDENERLSPREREVLELMATGFIYKEVAEKMGVTLETVRTYVKRICHKLQVRGKVEAILKYRS